MIATKMIFELVMSTPSNPETAKNYDVWRLNLNDTSIGWDLYEKGHSIEYIFKDLFQQYFWRNW